MIEQSQVRGFAVRVNNTRPDIATSDVLDRLGQALDLIARYAPRAFRRLHRDLAGFVVERFACRGAFFPASRECLTELTFTVNPAHELPEIASSIVHEGTHARIAAWCGTSSVEDRAREERICRRAELAFGRALPAGEGDVVIARALASLALDAGDVAPSVDWREAARRVAEADAHK
jgi:hypothetical protein